MFTHATGNPVRESDIARQADEHGQDATKLGGALSATDRQMLLHLARRTLALYLGKAEMPMLTTDSPALRQPRAVFVTLRRRDTGELRGCRGECSARRPLIEAVALMAVAAAVDDPRFDPVTADEVPSLHIEISALTPLQPIALDDVEVGRHGLMIVECGRAGLLLPQVPAYFGWGRQEFLAGLCEKAGLPWTAWQSPDAQLFGFETETWEEE